jgi:hypothetical protein
MVFGDSLFFWFKNRVKKKPQNGVKFNTPGHILPANVGWATSFCCPPFESEGGQQKDVAHPTLTANVQVFGL